MPFDRSVVRQLARETASKPYKAPDTKLPDNLKKLDYDHYRQIRFLPEHALWRGEKLPFEVQFFHRGFFYAPRVDIYEVANGQATKIPYRPDVFSFGSNQPPAADVDLGFAGFRIHSPINRPDYYDEVCVFLGASYFRAVAKGEIYGLSARGLAINAGEAKGEEFPSFKTFWIEKPTAKANSIVVHALLDSESAAAAYRFTIRPGETTIYDIEATLFPRVQIEQIGLASLTSMYFFGANDRRGVDDFRPEVHDSDGLGIQDAGGENLKAIPPAEIKGTVSFDKAKVRNVVAHPNPEIGGTRLSFQLVQGSEKAIELRAQLFRGDDPLSEVWMDRWTL